MYLGTYCSHLTGGQHSPAPRTPLGALTHLAVKFIVQLHCARYVGKARPAFCFFLLPVNFLGTNTIPILQMNKLRFRRVQCLAQRHTGSGRASISRLADPTLTIVQMFFFPQACWDHYITSTPFLALFFFSDDLFFIYF